MSDHDIDYASIRERVIQKTQRRYRFIAHTVIFVLGFPLIGAISPLVFLLWILAWAFHFLWLNYHHALETALDQAYDAERDRLYKHKPELDLRLGDDSYTPEDYYPPAPLESDDDEYRTWRR